MLKKKNSESLPGEDQNTESFFCVIPWAILSSRKLKPITKLLYGEISGLTRRSGYCTASNAYLGEALSIHPRTVRKELETLKNSKLIRVYVDNFVDNSRGAMQRRIFLDFKSYPLIHKAQQGRGGGPGGPHINRVYKYRTTNNASQKKRSGLQPIREQLEKLKSSGRFSVLRKGRALK